MIDFFDAVFFDMDGLTVDSEPQWLLSEQEVVEPFGYVWTQEDQVACLGGPLSKLGDYMSQRVGSKQTSEYFVQELIRIQRFPVFLGYFCDPLFQSDIPFLLRSDS